MGPSDDDMAKSGDWWSKYFDASYLDEYAPLFDVTRDRVEVARLLDLLALPAGARLLDCPCGQGRHAHLLAEGGFDVTGYDLSPTLLDVARKRGQGPHLRYRAGDMRRLPAAWSGRFDGVLNLWSSFGFFRDPRDDDRVLSEFARVLRPGGVFVWHGASRDGVMASFVSKDWWETPSRTLVTHERSFDPLSGVLTVDVSLRQASRTRRRSYTMRLYSASELASRLARVGIVILEAFAGFRPRPLTRRSGEMLLVGRKEA